MNASKQERYARALEPPRVAGWVGESPMRCGGVGAHAVQVTAAESGRVSALLRLWHGKSSRDKQCPRSFVHIAIDHILLATSAVQGLRSHRCTQVNMEPPFPSVTSKWHNDTYPSISPSRPELSLRGKSVIITGAV